jgi:2,3-bisphosphoglycerate-dependent phosphoglycerate mutase
MRVLRIGGQTYDIAPAAVIEGFFATISYRLEPDGRGTRFPIVMDRLYAGRMSTADAPQALRELAEIDSGLVRLTPDRVVWSLSDLRLPDDSGVAVNRAARNARDYFVAPDGRPLLAVFREAVQLSVERNEPVVLDSPEVSNKNRRAAGALIFGLLWTAVGFLFFRTWVLVPIGSDSHAGPLIWPVGLFIFSAGVTGLVGARYPALSLWYGRSTGLKLFVIFLGMGLYLVLGFGLQSR